MLQPVIIAADQTDGQFAICDERYATSVVGLYSRKVVNGVVGDTVLSYVRPAFVNSYPGVCGRQREGQTRVRVGGRPHLPPVPAVSLPPRSPPSIPPARRRLTGTPVRSRRTDGRATYEAALADRRRWTAHEDDAAVRLFATNILQLLTLNFERSRNIVVKISQRINRWKTL